MEGLLETVSPSPTSHSWESEAQWRMDLPQVTDNDRGPECSLCLPLHQTVFLNISVGVPQPHGLRQARGLK